MSMFNKLVLENLDQPFDITFVWADHTIPTGKFEAEQTLGEFILQVSSKWGKNVKRVGQPVAPKIEAITEIAPIQEPVEEVKEEVKEVVKVEPKKLAKKK